MTHSELVERAVYWLQGRGGCTFAFSELAASGEVPDAIGFRSRWSIVVECKTNRADFFADGQKRFRRNPATGMGAERYFMVPAGLILPHELPQKWGLLWVYDRHVRVIKKAEGFSNRSYMAEIDFLVSMLRRAEIRGIAAYRRDGHPCPLDFLNQWIKARKEQGYELP